MGEGQQETGGTSGNVWWGKSVTVTATDRAYCVCVCMYVCMYYYMCVCVSGAWSCCWRDCLLCLLSPLQTVHSQTHQATGAGNAGPRRLSLHQSNWIHVSQVRLTTTIELCGVCVRECVLVGSVSKTIDTFESVCVLESDFCRYCQPPLDLWEWFEPYLDDPEVRAGSFTSWSSLTQCCKQ